VLLSKAVQRLAGDELLRDLSTKAIDIIATALEEFLNI
jgi:hypothetical protein